MTNISRNFIAGKMNKTVDERLIPDGEYIDALNCRLGSSEKSEVGAVENSKGNIALTSLTYINGASLSSQARCIGAYEDGANETLYWFVHDPAFTAAGATGKLDMIVSYNTTTTALTYHVVSIDDGGGANTTLNFNPIYLITGVNLVEVNPQGNFMLFFTDNYNPPRFINTGRTYAQPVANVDQFDDESILVIKRPPNQSPGLILQDTGGEENYMKDRFLCFAYRYRYEDGEYSAISMFSAPAFAPKQFNISPDSYLNIGMENLYNSVVVTYNTGGPLVKGIDLLYKDMESNVIRVIEKLDKAKLGFPDNTLQFYSFTNSKIFTVLTESEIFRLYDNVPRLAKAQTIMGNRLMYGNYVEGYDLIDLNGNQVRFDYYTDPVSTVIGQVELPTSLGFGLYDLPQSGPTNSFPNTKFTVNLSSVSTKLKKGGVLRFELEVSHSSVPPSYPFGWSPGTPVFPSGVNAFSVNFEFVLPKDYANVPALFASTEFKNAIGVASPPNFQPLFPLFLASNGKTFTDFYNAQLLSVLPSMSGNFSLLRSAIGISGPIPTIGEPIPVGNPTTNQLDFKILFPLYEITTAPPGTEEWEILKIDSAKAYFTPAFGERSLHSNRGYEVGIVYMDEFGRSSTALVSNNNTVFFDCGQSVKKNQIKVTIPTTQRAPSWATRYKFVLKPDKANYETIYSNLYFVDNPTNTLWALLEGENARKVESGDRLIVKADESGAKTSCAYVTILEKESKAADFVAIPNQLDPSQDIPVPSGVYAKISTTNPNLDVSTNQFKNISFGTKTVIQDNVSVVPVMDYTVNILDPTSGNYIDNPGSDPYLIPAGSRINLSFKFERKGPGDGGGACERRIYTLEQNYISTGDYIGFDDWFNGDNIDGYLDLGIKDVGDPTNNPPINNRYDATQYSIPPNSTSICNGFGGCDFTAYNFYRFFRDSGNNRLALTMTGPPSCGWDNDSQSSITVSISILRAGGTLIFETEPVDASPDIFFENEFSYPIDTTTGDHLSGIMIGDVNQDIALGIPGIVYPSFFNCFTFGNGAESYRVRDSLKGQPFLLGNRVTAVSAQDYKEAHRFADITYSGIYNDESNVNKLNEFNIGLLNYKTLEDSCGPIMILDGRETDVLVLQEDKVSYVLAGKNLLSDAAAGGAITSVPEVLGTQIARIEKNGISFHPESYVKWGANKFFTDAKRGAVIQLSGGSYSNEQMGLISLTGMRSWFRDLFIDSMYTQKLGGYDPYMDEYVLSSNETPIPIIDDCIDCGTTQKFTLPFRGGGAIPYSYCVNLGLPIGSVDVDYTISIVSGAPTVDISATFDGSTSSTGAVNTSGTLTFSKSTNNTNGTISLQYGGSGEMMLEITVRCPESIPLNLVEVCVSDNADAGKFIHNEFRYQSGAYISPTSSDLVTLASGFSYPLISNYDITSGFQGTGYFPVNGSTVRIISNKILFDNYNFDSVNNRLMYFRTNVFYPNTPVGVQNLLLAATNATPLVNVGSAWYAEFIMPGGMPNDYLYLIWDYRTQVSEELCYSSVSAEDACCDCEQCEELCSSWSATAGPAGALLVYNDCSEAQFPTIVYVDPEDTIIICASNEPQVVEGLAEISFADCGCVPIPLET